MFEKLKEVQRDESALSKGCVTGDEVRVLHVNQNTQDCVDFIYFLMNNGKPLKIFSRERHGQVCLL